MLTQLFQINTLPNNDTSTTPWIGITTCESGLYAVSQDMDLYRYVTSNEMFEYMTKINTRPLIGFDKLVDLNRYSLWVNFSLSAQLRIETGEIYVDNGKIKLNKIYDLYSQEYVESGKLYDDVSDAINSSTIVGYDVACCKLNTNNTVNSIDSDPVVQINNIYIEHLSPTPLMQENTCITRHSTMVIFPSTAHDDINTNNEQIIKIDVNKACACIERATENVNQRSLKPKLCEKIFGVGKYLYFVDNIGQAWQYDPTNPMSFVRFCEQLPEISTICGDHNNLYVTQQSGNVYEYTLDSTLSF